MPQLWTVNDISSRTDWGDFWQLAFGWQVARNVLEERCRAFQMLATRRMRIEHHDRFPILVPNGINGAHLIGISCHEYKTVRKNAKAPTFRPGPCAAEAEPSGLMCVLWHIFSRNAIAPPQPRPQPRNQPSPNHPVTSSGKSRRINEGMPISPLGFYALCAQSRTRTSMQPFFSKVSKHPSVLLTSETFRKTRRPTRASLSTATVDERTL